MNTQTLKELSEIYICSNVVKTIDDEGKETITSAKVVDTPENYYRYLTKYHDNDFLYNELKERYEYAENRTPCEDAYIRQMFRSEFPISTSREKIEDSFYIWVKKHHSYNPIKEYLNSLVNTWDSEKRLETLVIKYLKAEDTPINRIMTKNWFIQAVRNIFEPSKYKFVHRLVLNGPSDGGKSKFFEILFTINNKQYFTSDIDVEQDDKTIAPKLNATWLVMFGEGRGLAKKENAAKKQFMDRLTNIMEYQKKFQNNVTEYYPHNIICETGNDKTILNDYTVDYDKRSWIIPINSDTKYFTSVHDELVSLKDQIWAEAVYYYLENKSIYLELPSEYIQNLKDIQEEYKTIQHKDIQDEIEEILDRMYNVQIFTTNRGTSYYYFKNKEDFLNQLKDNGKSLPYCQNPNKINVITKQDIAAIILYKNWDSRHKSKFNEIFEELGWKDTTIRINGKPMNVWFRNEVTETPLNQIMPEASLFDM